MCAGPGAAADPDRSEWRCSQPGERAERARPVVAQLAHPRDALIADRLCEIIAAQEGIAAKDVKGLVDSEKKRIGSGVVTVVLKGEDGTAAIVSALDDQYAGLFARDEDLAAALQSANASIVVCMRSRNGEQQDGNDQ